MKEVLTIIGLEIICMTYGLQNKEVAEMLNVSPGTFADWISGRRRIPEERLKQLSELKVFKGIPKEYFQKELKQHEKLMLESIKITNDYNLTKKDGYFVDSDGNKDEGMSRHLQFNDLKIEFLKAIERLKEASMVNWNCNDEELTDLMHYQTEAVNLLAELFGRNNTEERYGVLNLLRKYSFVSNEKITFDTATHWIPTSIEPFCANRITIGKPYKILYNAKTDQYYMIDDSGDNSVWFLVVEGRYACIP